MDFKPTGARVVKPTQRDQCFNVASQVSKLLSTSTIHGGRYVVFGTPWRVKVTF